VAGIANLAGNAVKFTEHSEVALRVALVHADAEELVLRFTGSDTGIGIPATLRPRLFEPFTQADRSMTRRYGSTGLGLAISQRLVKLMRGVIGFETSEWHRSSFWFIVRFKPVSQEPEANQYGSSEAALSGDSLTRVAAAHYTTLIVEDDPFNQRMLEVFLRKAGRV
jgi:K+-sensing histidine kinase KdpD